jgi:hypothetical protein
MRAGILVTRQDAAANPGPVIFEYIGRTALSVLGRASGIEYRFDQPGTRLTVDGRDRDSLDLLPMLKQVG